MKIMAVLSILFILGKGAFAESPCGKIYSCRKDAKGEFTLVESYSEQIPGGSGEKCMRKTVAEFGTDRKDCVKSADMLREDSDPN